MTKQSSRSPATLSTPRGTGPRISRSIHCQIPRSVPQAVSSSITHLELGNVQFALFAHVSHVLYELASLTRFRGSKLTWPRVGATLDTGVFWVRRWKTEQRKFEEFALMGCTQAWPFLWFFQLLSYTREDAAIVGRLIEVVEDGLVDVEKATMVCTGPRAGG